MIDKNKIKNILFDLDNTILLDTYAYLSTYEDALKSLKIDVGYAPKLFEAVDAYDNFVDEEKLYYSKQDMLDFINNRLSTNFEMKVIDTLNEVVGKTWIKDILLGENVLDYLSEKYNIYIYTSYFEESQRNRIKNINYLKYFKDIFGADRVGTKPFKKSIENVLNLINGNSENTIMIGDTKRKDIKAANNVNMKSILFDRDGTRDDKNLNLKDYIVIKDMNELLDIL